MKTFKQHMNEMVVGSGAKTAASVGTTVDGQSVEDSVIGVHNIHDEEVLKVVNGFVGAIAGREYLNPQHAVNELKEKLSRVGLSFECELEGDNGTTTCEVSQFGGRFGKDTDGTDLNDDGISHRKEGGLKLEVKHEKLSTGSSKVYAKLV